MSKLGEQINKLRTLASELEQFIADYDGFTREEDAMLVTSMDTMREAADTITSLWNSLTASEAALNKAAGNWAKADAQLRESYGQYPEQGERENEGERESYDAGFSNGVKACLQQLDGLILEGADVDEIQAWVDRQWEEEVV